MLLYSQTKLYTVVQENRIKGKVIGRNQKGDSKFYKWLYHAYMHTHTTYCGLLSCFSRS